MRLSPEERAAKEYVKKNPFNKYPMLETADFTLVDGFAISKFLAVDTPLLSADKLESALMTQDIKMLESQVVPCIDLATGVIFGSENGINQDLYNECVKVIKDFTKTINSRIKSDAKPNLADYWVAGHLAICW